ncbi:hypothetical protein [Desulforamulus reducens]|uniref:hypothetical protein n=1 Tax=Desulforamulus reducens TaxID=59610 RepID=UPI0002EF081F|nr:hypothetical protein [Desulforamulus reducens]
MGYGYGFGPGLNKPGKKTKQKPVAKPTVQKPIEPKQPQKPALPPFPFDLGNLFGGKWNKK